MAKYQTESERVHIEIRDAILNGRLAPGERLPQRKIALRFNATTMTVREAFLALVNEGLIVIEPQWGATVEEITEEKIKNQFVLREALEGMSARLASQHITPAGRKKLVELGKRCDRMLLLDTLSPSEKTILHFTFHQLVSSFSRCKELENLLQRINLYSIFLLVARQVDMRLERPDNHYNLAVSINSGDPDAAERGMRDHIAFGLKVLRESMRLRKAGKLAPAWPWIPPL